jgi:hypothetical protein
MKLDWRLLFIRGIDTIGGTIHSMSSSQGDSNFIFLFIETHDETAARGAAQIFFILVSSSSNR